jgi:uncharacterized protein YndB with AHSA1/START domain
MTLAIKPAPVTRSLYVAAKPARAFEVFTAGFDRWWPRSHSIGDSPLKEGVLEGKLGGRWYGLLEDGTEAEWGDVLVWEPPGRLVLAWRISTSWQYDPDLLTEVEVSFSPEGEGTRVNFEHRGLERMGEKAGEIREMFNADGGWGSIMQAFADEAAKG